MKNISYVINGIFAIAIIILFVLFFTVKNTSCGAAQLSFEKNDSTATLPIAYVNVDSIVLNYNFAKDANDRLMKKINNAQSTLTQKQRQIETEQKEFNKKLQQNAFLSEERAKQEYERIGKLATDYQALEQRLNDEIAREQQQMTGQITDSIRSCIERYNKVANYELIFLNNGHDNIITARDNYDITTNILSILNSRYTPNK